MKNAAKSTQEHLAPSELLLNPDGSIYHLKLKPEDIANTILVVGDQGRVEMISSCFDEIQVKVQNREFCTHTGLLNGKRITAISSGIGTDNIDIVINELDALVNVDLEKRQIKPEHTSLNLVRIGTCGGLQLHTKPGDFILSSYGLGLDGMLNFYQLNFEADELELADALKSHLGMREFGIQPYVARASQALTETLGEGMHQGVTATANGFYGPQGRSIRLEPALQGINDRLESFEHQGLQIVNYEMETSALYGLGASLGHECATVCLVIANRPSQKALVDYKPKMKELIDLILHRLTN